MLKPYADESSRMRVRARSPLPWSFSAPSTTFSSTVRLSASMKCWKTMPMPAAIASDGEWKDTSRPSTSIVLLTGLTVM